MTIEDHIHLVDHRLQPSYEQELWPAMVVRSGEIKTAQESLMHGGVGADGRREFSLVHPRSAKHERAIAPTIDVRFGVILPGEKTIVRRTNASSFNFALSGRGLAVIGDTRLDVENRDGWTVPAMQPEVLENAGEEPFHYVSYSNDVFLKRLEALYVDYQPEPMDAFANTLAAGADVIDSAKELAGGAVPLGHGKGALLPYEHLVDPEFVDNPPLIWPWRDVAPHMGLVRSIGKNYNGRPLWVYYNPATGRRNGTTFSFFATMTSAPADAVGPVHRHMSAAVNFILEGSGWSVVDGERIEWGAGDIMLAAPSWAPHGHATGPDGALILTIQDHPLHIGTESLVWQEDLNDGPILTLGAQAGFQTNLAAAQRS